MRTPEQSLPRSHYVGVRLTPTDAETLDRLRAGKTRSAYLRELLSSAADNERNPNGTDRA